MIFIDDRTEHQKKTHCLIVLATDSFMSGWGRAEGGSSYAGWSCEPINERAVERWVRNRGEMKRVRIVSGNYKPPNVEGHCHIYVVENGHPALS